MLKKFTRGFSLIEVLVSVAVFLLFALGVYGALQIVFKIVYQSRLKILETSVLSEELEIARNLPYDSIGIMDGVPAGVLQRTKNITRNGVPLVITATVRNIDNEFDGTAGGSPNDTSPADFKLVEMSALCTGGCFQRTPVILSTIIPPKNLEGASYNGSLFINVFDSIGAPVSGASVHVVNTSRTPNTVIDDVTDNDGWLRIVDTPTGTVSYQITVSKSGYSSDYTVVPSPSNLTPVKPPSTIASQTVTEAYFAIDRLSSATLHTVTPSCASLGSVGLNVRGQKLLGTDPSVYKYNQNFSTSAGGTYSFPSWEWDKYLFTPTGSIYDISGSIPMSPINLIAGSSQDIHLILRSHTSNSLLVKVRDAGTQLPLSDATVQLTKTGYDQSVITGLGYMRQTDWSGGSGQILFTQENKYFTSDGNVETNSPKGDLKLRRPTSKYVSSGYLESSTFDLGAGVDFQNIIIDFSQVSQTGPDSLSFQLAGSTSSTPASWNFVGPDGTSATYYTPTNNVIHSDLDGKQYLRYRVYLTTANTSFSPQLFEVAFTYTNDCTPPGQAFFSGLSASTYTLTVTHDGYTTNAGEVEVSGQTEANVDLSVE